MGIAESLAGKDLPGKKKSWKVIERLATDEDQSGMYHSIGYKVISSDGQEAFMKVTDLDLFTKSNYSLLDRAQVALQAHKIERQMLEHCRGNNMDRIVVAVDFGETIIEEKTGKEIIFYLMFELAESDVRVHVDTRTAFDMIWTLSALHDLAVAIQQLHKGQVNHNDIKPENFLVFRTPTFDERHQMLADLGCATSPLINGIYDDHVCIGDPRYAAPELIYGMKTDKNLQSFDARRAIDIYHLGSMIFFLVTGRMLTPQIVQKLSPEFRPPSDNDEWTGNFESVLPYWREAFARTLEDFVGYLPKTKAGELTVLGTKLLTALSELAEPNPSIRGFPQSNTASGDRLSVQQYISLFNDLRRHVLH